MKRLTFTMLLISSTFVFAKTEEPKTKTDLLKKEDRVLMAKKTVKKADELKKVLEISTVAKQEELTDAAACAIELALGPVIAGPPYHCTKI